MALSVPPEPVRLRQELRALAGGDPDAARAEISKRLAPRLWRSWRDQLAPRGGTPALLRRQLDAAAYETWLWVMGDRIWPQVATAISGRLDRRLAPIDPEGRAASS